MHRAIKSGAYKPDERLPTEHDLAAEFEVSRPVIREALKRLRDQSLMLALLVASCSQEKDAFLNRTFHRLTARDNGWFNANEKLKEVVTGIEDAHVDDYDEVLPLFVYGTDEQAKAAPGLTAVIGRFANRPRRIPGTPESIDLITQSQTRGESHIELVILLAE